MNPFVNRLRRFVENRLRRFVVKNAGGFCRGVDWDTKTLSLDSTRFCWTYPGVETSAPRYFLYHHFIGNVTPKTSFVAVCKELQCVNPCHMQIKKPKINIFKKKRPPVFQKPVEVSVDIIRELGTRSDRELGRKYKVGKDTVRRLRLLHEVKCFQPKKFHWREK